MVVGSCQLTTVPARDTEVVQAGGDPFRLVAVLARREHAPVLVGEQRAVGALGRVVLDQSPVGRWVLRDRVVHRFRPS